MSFYRSSSRCVDKRRSESRQQVILARPKSVLFSTHRFLFRVYRENVMAFIKPKERSEERLWSGLSLLGTQECDNCSSRFCSLSR